MAGTGGSASGGGGGLFSLALASDSLGLGSAVQGFLNAEGTELCGRAPNCVSFGQGSNCDKQHREFHECRMMAMSSGAAQTRNQDTKLKINWKYIIAAIVIVIVIAVVIRKK